MNQSQSHSKTALYGTVGLIVLIWSTAYTLMYYTVYSGGFPAGWIPAARTVLPAIGITIYVYMRGLKLPPLTDPRWFWFGMMGFLGMTAPFYLHAKGYEGGVGSGMGAILTNGATPLFAIALAHLFVQTERLTMRKSAGFLIGFIGVIFLNLPEDLSWSLIEGWRSQGLFLLAAFCFAMAAIVAKRAPDTNASIGAAIMLITSAVTAIILALASGVPSEFSAMKFSSGVLAALFALSIFSTGLSDILYLRVIKMSGPTMIARINYLVPVFAMIFGIALLGENFSWRAVAAMMIIITGLLIARNDEAVQDE